jgi:hypothetical protein
MKSALPRFAAAGAIVLSTVAVTLPAGAATVTSSQVSSSAPAIITIPDSVGKVLCSGDLCIQRITGISNGTAYVEAWANTYGFTGHFELSGPNGLIGNSKTTYWYAGGPGKEFLVPQGGGYTMTAWQGSSPPYRIIGQVNFSV